MATCIAIIYSWLSELALCMTTLTRDLSFFKGLPFLCGSFHSWCDETACFSDEEQPSNDWDGAEEGVAGLLKIVEMAPSTFLYSKTCC